VKNLEEKEKVDKTRELATEQAEFEILEWEESNAETNEKACRINRKLFHKGITQLKSKGIDEREIENIKTKYVGCRKRPMGFDYDKTSKLAVVNVDGLSGRCLPENMEAMVKEMREEAYSILYEDLQLPYLDMRELLVEIGFIKWDKPIITDGITADSIRKDVEKKDRFR
jgi:hypothetical protein